MTLSTKRPLGNTGIELSPVVMGTWQAGHEYWLDIDDAVMTRAIHAAIDAGTNAFDTAEEYGAGHSERVLGAALADRRDGAVIMSKVSSDHLRRDQVIDACERSLTNLRTDHLDVYYIHWPSGSWGSDAVPIAETMDAMETLRTQGKIRAVGVSNFTLPQLRAARTHGRIDALQPSYSLFWRHVDVALGPYCREHDIAILAYSPLAQGLLTGKFAPGHTFPEGDHRHANKLFHEPHATRVHAALDALRPMAADHGVTLGQLALAWLVHQPGTHAIAGARNPAQAAQNAAAAAVLLSPEQLRAIDAIGRTVSDPLAADPLLWNWQP